MKDGDKMNRKKAMKQDSIKFDSVPEAVPEQRAYTAMLIDGLIDFVIFFIYIFAVRSWVEFHTSTLLIRGIVELRPIVIFDAILWLEFIMAVFELIGYTILRRNDGKETTLVENIKKIFLLSHLFLVPAGVLLDLVLQFIGI